MALWGTLIDEYSVLTAGHCSLAAPKLEEVYPPQRLRVIVGRTVLTSSQGQVRSVKRIFVHPDLKEIPQTNNEPYWLQEKYDAAVLELSRPVVSIAPIKLATSKQDYLESPGRIAKVAGWASRSRTSPGAHWPPESVVQDRLRAAQVPIVSDSGAEQIYTEYIPAILVAASGKGKGPCLGDSDGPLFFALAPDGGSSSGNYAQIGVASYGAECATKGGPAVYTEVNNPSIRSFIEGAASR